MYKLFLCLKYLRRRYLALIAVAAVALCVAMVLIVVSVMDGFLNKVETAAKGLFGDIIVDSAGVGGIARYDAFRDYLRAHVPEVEASTPVIYSYGIMRIGDSYTETVQIAGIRLPERTAVTSFSNGLFVQQGRADASFEPSIAQMLAADQAQLDLIGQIRARQAALPPAKRDEALLARLAGAAATLEAMTAELKDQEESARWKAQQTAELAKPESARDAALLARAAARLDELAARSHQPILAPEKHMILGLGIGGLSFRTPEGQTVRVGVPPRKVILTLLPLGRGVGTVPTPNTATFTVVDDAKTDIYSIDSKTVYVPFETLQKLSDMDERANLDDPALPEPARCSQIQIKVKPAYASDRHLIEVRRKIEAAWDAFATAGSAGDGLPTLRQEPEVIVQTWREKLGKYIGPIEKQRTLVTLMFGIISFVSVLLVFAIFYMIVMQKIRDIGVVRAVGGSSGGVAGIFLAFGAATGLVGSVLGVTAGWLFVYYINEVQDWLAAVAGFRVFDREVFLFDKIPNHVDPAVALVIALWAVFSGLVGALIPGVRAAVMEPVEAIRYE